MPIFCMRCGAHQPTEQATFCANCGGPLTAPQYAPAPSFSAMQRTESTVIQAAPNYENFKIGEMQMFGWNLQGRQEIHEEGDAYGRSVNDSYVITTKVSQYVKLHFSRSLALPNLEQIRLIEAEYNSLPFPSSQGVGCAIALLIIGLIGLFFAGMFGVATLASAENPANANALPALIVASVFIAAVPLIMVVGGVLWIVVSTKKTRESNLICQVSAQRAQQLKAALAAYI